MKKPADPRHQARRLALQTIFEWSFLSIDPVQILDYIQREFTAEDEASHGFEQKLCEAIVKGATKNREKIDKIIEKSAREWPLNQIPKVDLTILRMAVFELMSATETPPKVVIDEAVELAKEFGSDNSPKFVNGVLGTVLKQTQLEKDRKLKAKDKN